MPSPATAGSPCRLSSTRRDRPRAGGHALLSAVPKAGGLLRSRKRGQAQGVPALPPPPGSPPPSSWPLWPRWPARLTPHRLPRRRPQAPGCPPRSPGPAPALVAVEFPQPIAPLAGEAALAAGGRSSRGRRRRRRAARPERRGARGARGRAGAGTARRRRARARARRKPPGTLAPALTGPRRAHPSPGQQRAGQYAASRGLPGPALVVIRRGREFKLGLGARARLRGVAGAEAGLWPRSSGGSLAHPAQPFRLLFSFPTGMWGAEEVAGSTCFARSGSPIKWYMMIRSEAKPKFMYALTES